MGRLWNTNQIGILDSLFDYNWYSKPSIVAVDDSLASFAIDEHFQVIVVEAYANKMLLLL